MKRSLLFGVIILLMGVLITGCPDPVTPAPTPGPNPDPVITPIVSSGTTTLTATEFKTKLEDTTYYEIPKEGLTISGATGDTFTVSATVKKLKLSGHLTLPDESIIVFKNKDSVEKGTGTIKPASANSKVIIIADSGVKGIEATNTTFITPFSGSVSSTDTNIGVVGNLTISGNNTAAANIKDSELASKNLYVVGNLTVDSAVNAASITVHGSVEAKANVTAPLSVVGSVTVPTGIAAGVIFSSLSATGSVTASSATTITAYNPSAPGAIIAGTTAVTIGTLGPTATNTVTITNTGGVTLTGENTIAANLKVNNAKITGSAATGAGVLIDSDAANIVVHADESIVTTTVTGANVSNIVAGGATDKVTLTNATLGPGTYTGTTTGLTLGSTAKVTVAGTGEVNIAGSGILTFGTAATSQLILEPGAKVDVVAATGDITGTDRTKVTLLVAASTAPTQGTKKNVTNTTTAWTVATAGDMTNGTVVLGKIKFAITTDDTNAVIGANADTDAAVGSLTAGTGTILTLAGAP
jgi:hypothetical protein